MVINSPPPYHPDFYENRRCSTDEQVTPHDEQTNNNCPTFAHVLLNDLITYPVVAHGDLESHFGVYYQCMRSSGVILKVEFLINLN